MVTYILVEIGTGYNTNFVYTGIVYKYTTFIQIVIKDCISFWFSVKYVYLDSTPIGVVSILTFDELIIFIPKN